MAVTRRDGSNLIMVTFYFFSMEPYKAQNYIRSNQSCLLRPTERCTNVETQRLTEKKTALKTAFPLFTENTPRSHGLADEIPGKRFASDFILIILLLLVNNFEVVTLIFLKIVDNATRHNKRIQT